jgi:hypothetical protein
MAALVGPPFDADQSFLAAWMRQGRSTVKQPWDAGLVYRNQVERAAIAAISAMLPKRK